MILMPDLFSFAYVPGRYAQEEGGTDQWAKENAASGLLSRMRAADHGCSIWYKDAVNYPEEGPVSRFYCEVRALRRGGWDYQN